MVKMPIRALAAAVRLAKLCLPKYRLTIQCRLLESRVGPGSIGSRRLLPKTGLWSGLSPPMAVEQVVVAVFRDNEIARAPLSGVLSSPQLPKQRTAWDEW